MSLEALERMLDAVPEPVLVKDRDHRWMMLNHAACALLGHRREDLRGRTDRNLVPKEQADDSWAVDEEVFSTGEEREVEETFTTPQGKVHFLKTRKRLVILPGPHGDEEFLIASISDITQTRQAETVPRETDTQFRIIADHAPVVIWVSDPDSATTSLSRSWYQITGKAETDFLGHDWLATVHAEDRERVQQAFMAAAAQREPLQVEYRLRRADGNWGWMLDTGKPRFAVDGTFLGYVGSVLDMTGRGAGEAALRESEEHYRWSVELNPQIPWTADPEGLILEAGPRWYGRTGMPLEIALGTGWVERVHPEDVEAVQQRWTCSLRTGEPFEHEYRVRLTGGGYGWFRARAAARRDAGGRIVRWYGTLEDIHSEKMAEVALQESEAFAHGILESSPNCIMVLSLTGQLLYMNGTGCRRLDLDGTPSVEERGWKDLLLPEYGAEAETAMAAARTGRGHRFTVHRFSASGARQWFYITTTVIPDAAGQPARLLAIWHDVTETKHARELAEQARQDAENAAARLSSVLESTMDSVIVVDHDWRLTYVNGNAAQMLKDRNPAPGAHLGQMFPEEGDGVFAWKYKQAVARQRPVAFEEYLPAFGMWLEVHACPTPDGLSIFFRDTTERRRAEQERLIAQEKIVHMARHDALTGLPNRLHLRERLEAVLSESRATPQAAVLYLDLHGFKTINEGFGHEGFGHPAGDTLLRAVARRLQECVRESDLVARFGGDEFAIIQTPVDGGEEAADLARRIMEVLSKPFEIEGHQAAIGASIGLAIAPVDGDNPDQLLKAADIALYRAKADGRGTFCFFEAAMDRHLMARQALQLALHGALARNEFELHYQPQIELSSGQITGFEALLRWRHPERGMISPAEFIPLAEEEGGLIVRIGEWALLEACREAASWPDGSSIAVNLSPVQFRSRALVEAVNSALVTSGLEPGRLQLEITESVLLQDNETNLATLRDLRRLGTRIALDDFGTGYSSLGYLRSFAFDKIKLDRSFVSDLPSGPEAQAIVSAVAGLGAGLNIRTAAEGIETTDQLDMLRANGYDEGQGYLFGRPMPAADARHLISGSRTASGN